MIPSSRFPVDPVATIAGNQWFQRLTIDLYETLVLYLVETGILWDDSPRVSFLPVLRLAPTWAVARPHDGRGRGRCWAELPGRRAIGDLLHGSHDLGPWEGVVGRT